MRLLAALVGLTLLAGCDIPAAHTDPLVAIHQTFGGVSPSVEVQAVNVARCESDLTVSAVSPGGANWGLFQINVVHRADFEAVTGQPWSMVLDGYWNAVYAEKLWRALGWGPWSCRWAA